MRSTLPDRWRELRADEIPQEAIAEAMGVVGRLHGELLSVEPLGKRPGVETCGGCLLPSLEGT